MSGISEKHSPWFDKWLDFMDEAFHTLNLKSFQHLEDRMKEQLAVSRKTRGGGR